MNLAGRFRSTFNNRRAARIQQRTLLDISDNRRVSFRNLLGSLEPKDDHARFWDCKIPHLVQLRIGLDSRASSVYHQKKES